MLATFGAGKKFLSTPSGWRATVRVGCQTVGNRHISIHALRVEGDELSEAEAAAPTNFYPRPPGGGRRGVDGDVRRDQHFYPRPPGGGRPRKGSSHPDPVDYFYPRPPGGGRRRSRGQSGQTPDNFYPRPPGGGRRRLLQISSRVTYFYPRPPGGGRRAQAIENGQVMLFLSTPSGWRATV